MDLAFLVQAMKAPKAREGDLVTRRSTMILLPVLFLIAFLWTGEAWGRAEDSGSKGSRSSRAYQPPVDRSPEVLCGCTEVLKNFA
jgi:hypothetical protein